jgi:hypothetical protein
MIRNEWRNWRRKVRLPPAPGVDKELARDLSEEVLNSKRLIDQLNKRPGASGPLKLPPLARQMGNQTNGISSTRSIRA